MNFAKAVRATVIIPTFGEARFSRWAIRSIQEQTVGDIEIFIICDGSPSHMVSFFQAIADKDSRIKIHCFPKSKRTGEPYRDTIIRKEARGKNIFYCSHDDLWFPNHIAELENHPAPIHHYQARGVGAVPDEVEGVVQSLGVPAVGLERFVIRPDVVPFLAGIDVVRLGGERGDDE